MKRLIALIAAAFIALGAIAENYPYRSDVLWTTIPDHADWLYRTGEKATVDVSFVKYGMPRDGQISYTISDDMAKPDQSGSVTLKGGRAKIVIGTRKTPGFRDCVMKIALDGTTYEHHIKVGFDPEKIQPVTKEPADFEAFWKANLEEAARFPLTYTKELAKEYCTAKVDCYLIKLMLNSSQSVYAYLFYPKDAKKGSHPVVLCPPGAGIKTIKEPLKRIYYPEAGFIRMEMEIHGLDPRMTTEQFSDISNAFNYRDCGYMEDGIDSRDRYYMKRVYLALVKCIDLLTSLPEWDGRNVIVQGGSQGGGLSIVAAALDSRVTQAIVNHPAMADMAGIGWPHMTERILTPNNINTLSYYDVVNFARHIKGAKVFMTWGYNDVTCPPTTSYATWNVMNCEKEALITPVNEHWTSEPTERAQCKWALDHLIK